MNTVKFVVISNQLDEFKSILSKVVKQLKVEIDAGQQQQLLLYLDKLLFWNKAYNLTAIKHPKEALVKHIFDCLAIIPHLHSGRLLDIGTGAGLPGVIVAICEPKRPVTVLDSNKKKIRFIKQLASELKLTNLTPIANRIEDYNLGEDEKFDVVTSRAFASLTDFVSASAPRLAENGYLQAMKGLVPDKNDLQGLKEDWNITNLPIAVPQLNETRHIVELSRKKAPNFY